MAKTRSDNSNYPSRYSPNKDENGIAWITDRQYIVELICENKAAKDNNCLLYTSPSPRDRTRYRMPSSA